MEPESNQQITQNSVLESNELKSSVSVMDDTGERSGETNQMFMDVYKLDLKNPTDTFQN